jgi:Ca2+-binding EF-hand superfamily protein
MDDGFDDGFSDDQGAPHDQGNQGAQGYRGNRQRGDAFGGPGGFGGRGGRSNPLFEALDGDGDQMLTARELRKAATAIRTLDKDGDGAISVEEASPQRGPRDPAQMIDRIMEQSDTDGDGYLSQEEVLSMREPLGQMLGNADTDGDGSISKEELIKAMENMRGGPGGFGGPGVMGEPGGFGVPGGMGGSGGMDLQAMTNQFMAGDQNGDGMLSQQELQQMPPQASLMLGQNADTNGDGYLNSKEVAAAMQSAAQRMQQFRNWQGGFGRQRGGEQGGQR